MSIKENYLQTDLPLFKISGNWVHMTLCENNFGDQALLFQTLSGSILKMEGHI